MCYRLGCPFKKRPSFDDGFVRILIIGATGMTGTAVLKATVSCIWFKITIFTRRIKDTSIEDYLDQIIGLDRPRIVEGDMFDYESVLNAMMDNDAVFFSTTYFDTMRVESEIDQGKNVVRAAMAARIKHILYVGTPYSSLVMAERSKYYMGKEMVEAHIVGCGVPYTILHMGFYYENFFSVFRPHMITKNVYALALPMSNVPLNCGSVLDFGQAIARIMLRPDLYIFKTIKMATGYHTVEELAKTLDEHFNCLRFFDPKIPLSVYRSFDFEGAQDLASIFNFYRSIKEPWDLQIMKDLCGTYSTFKDWVGSQEPYLLEALGEHMDTVVQTNSELQPFKAAALKLLAQQSRLQSPSNVPSSSFKIWPLDQCAEKPRVGIKKLLSGNWFTRSITYVFGGKHSADKGSPRIPRRVSSAVDETVVAERRRSQDKITEIDVKSASSKRSSANSYAKSGDIKVKVNSGSVI